jgi:TolB protein
LAVVTGDDDEWFGAILSLEGGDLHRITPEGLIVGSVKWSPKGSRVAFDAVVGTNFDLFVVDESGSNARRLTTSPAIDARPEWSLDDSSLVFHSTRDFGSVYEDGRWKQFELYVLKLDGGTIERLTTNEVFDAHPDWCLAPRPVSPFAGGR